MNELINQASINSHQISEMLDVRHDKVKQSIKRLSTDKRGRKSVIALPPMGSVQTKANNREYTTSVYVFAGEQGRIDSIIVVAQLSPEFTAALVKRWDELEKQAVEPITHSLPQSFAEALQLAANQALKIEQDAPKVAHYNAVADRTTLLNATQVAHSVGLKSPQKLNDRLKKVGVYNGAIKRGKAFQSWFIEDGLGVMKQGSTGHMQPLFTTKGQIWVFELLGGAK